MESRVNISKGNFPFKSFSSGTYGAGFHSMPFQRELSPSHTTSYFDPDYLILQLNKYFSLSNEQVNVLSDLLNCIINSDITLSSHLSFERADEDDIVMHIKSSKGIHMLVIDTFGDIMISFSPFNGKGWREFYQYDNYDNETVLYKFLS